eukprot:11763066-Ditylum_brightwellii.AAC.1
MVSMEDVPDTRESNNKALSLQCKHKHEKEELAKQKGMENASDEYIEAMIYCQLWDSDSACKTVADVIRYMMTLKYKKDKLQMLKDNTQMCVLGMGWKQFKTQWSKMVHRKQFMS